MKTHNISATNLSLTANSILQAKNPETDPMLLPVLRFNGTTIVSFDKKNIFIAIEILVIKIIFF